MKHVFDPCSDQRRYWELVIWEGEQSDKQDSTVTNYASTSKLVKLLPNKMFLHPMHVQLLHQHLIGRTKLSKESTSIRCLLVSMLIIITES